MKETSPSSVGVKALIAMSNSRPSSREGAIDDKKWLAQAEAIRTFLESTSESPKPISSHARDTVLQQLQRGDAHVEARGKCWQHVAIELSDLPEWQQICDAPVQCKPPPTPTPIEASGADPLQGGLISPPPPGAGEAADVPALNLEYFGSSEPPHRSRSAQELRTTPKPASDSPPHSLSARNQADEDRAAKKTASDAPPSPTREAAPAQPTTTKPMAKMTMMERQNAWMRAKAAALEAAKAEKEKELNDSLKFKPDTESSKRTYKTTPAATIRPEHPRPVLSNPKPVPAAPAPPAATASKWTVAKAKMSKVKKAKSAKTKTDKAAAAVGAEKLAELLAQDKAATAKHAKNPAVDDEGEEGPEKAGEEEEEAPVQEEEEEEEEEVAPEEPFVPGSFWWRIEDGRGHYRVNDGSLFQMWTIYRRKDKSRDVEGSTY